jgi:CoA:oxalate CoA-transferase
VIIPPVPPLAGLRVLDLTRYIAGPLAGQMLADAGAEVIKVEPPGGEVSRHEPPQVRISDDHTTGLLFLRFNRGKKSVVIDTRSEAGRAEFIELIKTADVLLENFRPGMLESWGLGWEQLHDINPRLVYASISGFGYRDSPMRDTPTFNTIAESMAGLVSRLPDGDQPPESFFPVAMGDGVSGLFAVIGILQAVIQRDRTGEGAWLDLAMYDSLLAFNDVVVANASVVSGSGEPPPRHVSAPAGYFRAGDGWISMIIGTNRQWRVLCELVGWTDWLEDGRYDDRVARIADDREVIRPRLAEWLSLRTPRESVDLLAAVGIPSSPFQTGDDVIEDPQARARNMLRRYPALDGDVVFVGSPFGVRGSADGTAGDFAAPGAHNAEILTADHATEKEGGTA